MTESLEQQSARLADNCLKAITSPAQVHPDCWAQHFNEQIKKSLSDAEARGFQRAIDQIRAGIERELRYREFRKDQDGSGVGACKEILIYLKAMESVK